MCYDKWDKWNKPFVPHYIGGNNMSDNYNGQQGMNPQGQQFGGPQGPQYNPGQPGMNPQGQPGMNQHFDQGMRGNPQGGQFGAGPQSPQFNQGQPQFNPGPQGMPQGGKPGMNPQGSQPGMNPQGGQYGAGPQSPQFNQGQPQFNPGPQGMPQGGQPGMNPQQPKRPQSGPSMQYHGDSENAGQTPNYVNPQFKPGQPGGPGQPDLQKPEKNNTTLFIVLGVAGALILCLIIGIVVMAMKGKNRLETVNTPDTTTATTEEIPEFDTPDDTEATTEAVSDDTTEQDTEADTEADTQATATSAPVDGVSENPADYTFELNGVAYQLPCDFKVFADNGWSIDDTYTDGNEDTELKATTYSSFYITDGTARLMIHIFNPTGDVKAVKDCKVGQIEVEADETVSFSIAKGITLNSSREEVEAAFGTPQDVYESDDSASLSYEYDESNVYEEMEFYFYKKDSKYNHITLEKMEITEEDKGEASTDMPAYLSTYVAPKELGSDIEATIFQLDGKIYQLPCPLSEFTDDGWNVEEVNTTSVGAGNLELSAITLKKNDVEIRVGMYNFEKVEMISENCAVAHISLDYMKTKDGNVIDLPEDFCKFPGGLSFKSSKDDIKNAVSSNFEERIAEDHGMATYSLSEDNKRVEYQVSSTDDYNTMNATFKNTNWDY